MFGPFEMEWRWVLGRYARSEDVILPQLNEGNLKGK